MTLHALNPQTFNLLLNVKLALALSAGLVCPVPFVFVVLCILLLLRRPLEARSAEPKQLSYFVG